MTDPATLAIVGMVGSAAGGILGAMGAEQQGQAQAGMFTYQAGVARLNRQISSQNADWARASGEVEAQEAGMKTRAVMAETKAAQGASNLDLGGTASAVRASEYAVGAEDQAIVRSNAAKRAYGFEVEAGEAGLQATMYDTAAKTAKTAADISALSSIIGGATGVANKWYQYQSVFGKTGGGGSLPQAQPGDYGFVG